MGNLLYWMRDFISIYSLWAILSSHTGRWGAPKIIVYDQSAIKLILADYPCTAPRLSAVFAFMAKTVAPKSVKWQTNHTLCVPNIFGTHPGITLIDRVLDSLLTKGIHLKGN